MAVSQYHYFSFSPLQHILPPVHFGATFQIPQVMLSMAVYEVHHERITDTIEARREIEHLASQVPSIAANTEGDEVGGPMNVACEI